MSASPSTLLLASASPRRVELLRQIGITCVVRPVDIEEIPAPSESAEAYVLRVAEEKSAVALQQFGAALSILAADTEVACDGVIFGKPRDFEHASLMLQQLSGRTHEVFSAVSLRVGAWHRSACCRSEVSFAALSDGDIDAYWRTGEPEGKAGAYAIQGFGAQFIRQLSGSYSAVMGLPLFETAQLLREAGMTVPGAAVR